MITRIDYNKDEQKHSSRITMTDEDESSSSSSSSIISSIDLGGDVSELGSDYDDAALSFDDNDNDDDDDDDENLVKNIDGEDEDEEQWCTITNDAIKKRSDDDDNTESCEEKQLVVDEQQLPTEASREVDVDEMIVEALIENTTTDDETTDAAAAAGGGDKLTNAGQSLSKTVRGYGEVDDVRDDPFEMEVTSLPPLSVTATLSRSIESLCPMEPLKTMTSIFPNGLKIEYIIIFYLFVIVPGLLLLVDRITWRRHAYTLQHDLFLIQEKERHWQNDYDELLKINHQIQNDLDAIQLKERQWQSQKEDLLHRYHQTRNEWDVLRQKESSWQKYKKELLDMNQSLQNERFLLKQREAEWTAERERLTNPYFREGATTTNETPRHPLPFSFQIDNCWVTAKAEFDWGECEQKLEEDIKETYDSAKKLVTEGAGQVADYIGSVLKAGFQDYGFTSNDTCGFDESSSSKNCSSNDGGTEERGEDGSGGESAFDEWINLGSHKIGSLWNRAKTYLQDD